MKEQAEQIIHEIEEYLKSPTNEEVAHQLHENRKSIEKTLQATKRTDFSAAFIGKIGAGKTSAICKVSGLQYIEDGEIVDILKTGAGRTTVCEVKIEQAQKISIKISPLPDDEVKYVVHNFAEFIWNKANKNISDEDEGGNLLSEELTRCIRNMLGLTIEKKKQKDGKWKSTDKALEFSKQCTSVEEVNELMYACLALETRLDKEIWPNPTEAKNWQKWIKDNFSKINDGKAKTMSIPSLITVNGPFPLIKNGNTWKIVDTRGIDSYIHREDIRVALDTEGVFPVICSSFGDAPDADCRSFYDLGVKLGLGERVSRDVTLLILDKNESDKVADIDEEIVDITDRKSIGRNIREDQVSNKILHEYKISPNVLSFDSRLDSESAIWTELESRKDAYITSKLNYLAQLVSASRELLSAEEDKIVSFRSDIEHIVSEWRANADRHSPDWKHFGTNIRDIFSRSHHRTLAASIDRKGAFYNLNVYESINQLARSISVSFCEIEMRYIKDKLLLLSEKYPEFSNQISSLEHEFAAQFKSFSIFVGDVAKEHWVEKVQTFISIWHSMAVEWGCGPGYKDRVIAHWEEWINTEQSVAIHNALLRRIASAWGRVLVEK
jgi:hypothetical protein